MVAPTVSGKVVSDTGHEEHAERHQPARPAQARTSALPLPGSRVDAPREAFLECQGLSGCCDLCGQSRQGVLGACAWLGVQQQDLLAVGAGHSEFLDE